MLVLSRKPGERLIFALPDGRTAAVVVVRITNKNHVRLGCDFPADVIIDREEIHEMREIVQPGKSLVDQIVDLKNTLSLLRRLLADVEPYIVSPQALERMAEAYALLGIQNGRKTQAEDALDLAENERAG